MHKLCILAVFLAACYARPYYDQNAESHFTVHEKPPELVVNAGPEGVKVQAKPSKLQVLEYPGQQVSAQKRDDITNCYFGGEGCGGHGYGHGFGFGDHGLGGYGGHGLGGYGGHGLGGYGGYGGYGGHGFGAGYGYGGHGGYGYGDHGGWGHGGWGHGGHDVAFSGCLNNGGSFEDCHHDHTTYVPSHTPPVHVGPNAPPIHVGPHVSAVHVGPHVPSIHYGTHAPLYHVGPHVPYVHMPPPVHTVHAGPMGPPVHVSSPPTVYHQPPVVYHQPHVVGHAYDHDFDHCCGVAGDYSGHDGSGYGWGGHGYGGHGFGYGGYGHGGGHDGDCCVSGGYGHGYKRSTKHKRSIEGESSIDTTLTTKDVKTDITDNNKLVKRDAPYYGWHPFPASVHVGPHTPPIHIGPHYPPVHIGPHVPAVHIGPHVPYINIPAHVPAIHVRPHVPAVHISPPVPIINAGNHVPSVHVTSPPTVYHRPPIVIHQPHIVHGPAHSVYGHDIYGHGGYAGAYDHDGVVAGHGDVAYGHGVGGYAHFKRGTIPEAPKSGKKQFALKDLSSPRERRQLFGGNADGGDSVIFVHPGGSQTPVGPGAAISNQISNEGPLSGLESLPGAGGASAPSVIRAQPQVEAPQNQNQGGAFAKSGLSGLSALANSLSTSTKDQDRQIQELVGSLAGGLSGGLPQGLPAGLGGLPSNLASLAQSASQPSVGGAPEVSNQEQSIQTEGASQEPMSIQNAASQTEEASFQNERPSINIGGLQRGGFSTEERGRNSEENQEAGNEYRRSWVPARQYASFNEVNNDDVDDLDESMERDTKSTIPHEDDEIDTDIHERVHKDVIPRPEDFY